MSNENHETHAEIIAEARDKYTVHDCNECEYRKSCDLNSNGFDSDECKQKRQSIALLFGIEDGYFTKLLCRLEAARKREVDKLNSVIQTQRSTFDAEQDRHRREATAKKSLAVGNAAKLREALTKVSEWMAHRIATGGFEASPTIPTVLEDVVLPALAAPPRNCDVGTADEQAKRFEQFCGSVEGLCDKCELDKPGVVPTCGVLWSQWTYKAPAQKGGAK